MVLLNSMIDLPLRVDGWMDRPTIEGMHRRIDEWEGGAGWRTGRARYCLYWTDRGLKVYCVLVLV